MRYARLGSTDLTVPALSLGASPLGSVFRTVTVEDARVVVRTSLELGINFIDVAPYYGAGKAETVLGQALRGIPRADYILATKVGRYGKTVQECDYSASAVRTSIDVSLHRLGVDHVDLLQVHDIEFGDVRQIVDETLPALEEARQQGKARYIGITGFPLQLLDDVTARYPVDTVLSYGHLVLSDNALIDKLPAFKDRGVGVINAAPFVFGMLTSNAPPAWHPAPTPVQRLCRDVAQYCTSQGIQLEKLALQYATADHRLATTLAGTANPANLRAQARWLDEPLDQAALDTVLRKLAPIHNVTWSEGRLENN